MVVLRTVCGNVRSVGSLTTLGGRDGAACVAADVFLTQLLLYMTILIGKDPASILYSGSLYRQKTCLT